MRPEELHKATVRVFVEGKNGQGTRIEKSGTAFLIAPTLLLTCAHVVTDDYGQLLSEQVFLGRPDGDVKAQVQRPFFPVFPDLALLTITPADSAKLGLKRAPLGLQAHIEDEVYAYGYSNLRPNGDGDSFHVAAWVPFTEGGSTWETLKVKEGQVLPGMSGAPVLNVKTGRVCGVLKRTRDEQSDLGGIIVSMTAFLRYFPSDEHWFEGTVSPNAPTWNERDELVQLCQGHDIAQMYRVFGRFVPVVASVPVQEACPTLGIMLSYLAEFDAPPMQPDRHPIYLFAAELAGCAGNNNTTREIQNWIIAAYRARRFAEVLPETQPAFRATLQIEILSDPYPQGAGKTYTASASLRFPDKPRISPEFPELKNLAAENLKECYRNYVLTCLAQAEEFLGGGELQMEIRVPNVLLLAPCETFPVEEEFMEEELAKRRKITLRPGERDPRTMQRWRERWEGIVQLGNRPKVEALQWADDLPIAALPDGKALFEILKAPTVLALGVGHLDASVANAESYLRAAFAAGLPILLWGRKGDLDRTRMRAKIEEFFGKRKPLNLPDAFFEERRKPDGDDICLHTALIWDPYEESHYLQSP